jgi:flagellar motor component MotA
MYYLGVLLFLLIVFVVAIFRGLDFSDLIVVSDLLIVIIGVFAAALATGRINDIFKLFTTPDTNLAEKQKTEINRLLNYLITVSLVSGFIGFLIETIRNIRNTGLSIDIIVYRTGYSIYPIIYGLIISFIIIMPLKFRINRN